MINNSFMELRLLNENGYYEEFMRLLEKLHKTDKFIGEEFSSEEQFSLLLTEINSLHFYYRSEDALAILEKAKNYSGFQNLPLNKLGYIMLQINHFSWTQQNDKVDSLMNQGEDLLSLLSSSERTRPNTIIAHFNFLKGRYANQLNDPKEAIKYGNIAKNMFHNLEDSFHEIYSIIVMAYAYYLEGDTETSYDLYEQRHQLAESHNYPFLSSSSLAGLCYGYLEQGELTKALEAGHKSLEIWQLLQQRNPGLSDNQVILHNLGEIYRVKGDFDNALLYLKKSLKISKARKEVLAAERLTEIGKIYFQQGNITSAKDHLQQGYKLYHTQSNSGFGYLILHTIFGLIRVALEGNDLKQVQSYREEIYTFKINAKSKKDRQLSEEYIKLTDALILKQSSRFIQKANAQQQLTEFIKQKIVHHEIKALAIVHLCELLLDELRTYGDDEVFQETQNIIDQLYKLGKDYQIYPLIIQSLMLKTQLAIWKSELEIATKYASQAELLAEEKGLNLLGTQVAQLQQQLESDFVKAQELIQQNAPLQKRIEQSKLEHYVKEIQRTIKF